MRPIILAMGGRLKQVIPTALGCDSLGFQNGVGMIQRGAEDLRHAKGRRDHAEPHAC